MIGGFCLKAWSRLQQAVALSSAESELYGLVEGAKEALSIRRAISHVFGWEDLPKPYIYCDSEAAIAISRADGLRKVRHIDLRACFIQEASRLIFFASGGPSLGPGLGFVQGTSVPLPWFSLCFPSSFGPCEAGGVVCRQLPPELVAP